MCIRDRNQPEHGQERADQAARRRGGRKSAGSVAEIGDWRPVSYTHLRAHETVLDLVCRLLLEKKKKLKLSTY